MTAGDEQVRLATFRSSIHLGPGAGAQPSLYSVEGYAVVDLADNLRVQTNDPAVFEQVASVFAAEAARLRAEQVQS